MEQGVITRGIRSHHTLSFRLVSRLTNFGRGFEGLTTRTGWVVMGWGMAGGKGLITRGLHCIVPRFPLVHFLLP